MFNDKMTKKMKKILFFMSVFALLLVSCSPIDDKGSAMGASIDADYLASCVNMVQKSAGNNNFTYTTDPALPIQVLDNKGNVLAYGTQGSLQLLPGASSELTYRYLNSDGSPVTSNESFTVTDYTDVPHIYAEVYGPDYGKTVWVWDTEANGGYCWGNGGFMEDKVPNWYKVTWDATVSATDNIDAQAVAHGLPTDGLLGWFSLDCSNGQAVQTSRGETGTVSINPTVLKDGWDMGTITFSGTVPLLGVLPNSGDARQYTYYILTADGGDHIVLCAPEPGAGDWGAAWYWCFKRQGL